MSSIRVLIVDDEDRFRQLMAKLFTAKGLDVVTAANGPEALCRLEDAGPFDVVILDIKMPGPSGLDILPHLRACAPATQVIILTGHGDIQAASRSLQDGAAEFLLKPCSFEELLSAVHQAVDRMRTTTTP
jgi:DNA-binding NtrC family response regulator